MSESTVGRTSHSPGIIEAETLTPTCNTNNSTQKPKDKDTFQSHSQASSTYIAGAIGNAASSNGTVITSLTNACKPKNQSIDSLANKLSNIFSPFISFIQSFDLTSQNINNENKEQVANQISDMFDNLEETIEKDKCLNKTLSKESKESLKEFFAEVSHITDKENLEHLDLAKLVERWKTDKNYQTLLQMAELIKNGQGNVSFQRPELREAFIRALNSLGNSLKEELKNPNQTTREHLHQAADSTIDALHPIIKRGGDNDLTLAERRHVCERLKDTHKHIQAVTGDPELASHTGSALEGLYSFTSWLESFIENWNAELEEEEETKQEALCKERCEKEEESDKMHAIHKRAEQKRKEFYALMKEAKAKLNNLLETFKQENQHIINKNIHNQSTNLDYYLNKYRTEASTEDHYLNQERGIESSLPPASVCDNDPINDICFDTHC